MFTLNTIERLLVLSSIYYYRMCGNFISRTYEIYACDALVINMLPEI